MIIELLEAFFLFLTALMVIYMIRHYIFTVAVLRQANKNTRSSNLSPSGLKPTVSILIPACNEEKVIGRLLEQITNFTYPKEKLQVIVIDDSSSDKTGKIADSYKTNFPYIQVLHRDKSNGRKGKASAMNFGFARATGEIVLCFDADYYPQRDIVEKLSGAFVDPKVGAVQGRVVVLNEPENIVTRLVALERIGGYRVDQEARDSLGLITQFGGTVGGFRASILRELHGWDESVLAEDTDLTFRIYLAGYKIRYKVDAECYEEAVNSWKAYRQQRYRWAKGHMQCFFKHIHKVLTSKHLNLKEKMDGLLLLNVYFMPLIAFLSLLIGLPLIFLGSPLIGALWFSVPVSLYSFVGNFAPFFEVGVGLYLDDRERTQWLIPLLVFTFLYNIPICLKALVDVLVSKVLGRHRYVWVKTSHTGNGNCYITN
ncbi:MAG: glycosyltransferase family 2 protein [Candidatus Bathyarchaeota archaeon]|nr:glycosyltransferase family 2 protein [Candidatus Bathyarchaeota archaeon]